ncbi:MAG TPA: hypothetical protein QF753_04005 [Victivallales bacterium]|nr:hypothetical protein [Victivallales bacterium]
MQRNNNKSKSKNISIAVEFTSKNLTSWGGIASIISHYLEKLNFEKLVTDNIPIEDTSNNSVSKYSKVLLLEIFTWR